jgi:hypothetical protein
MMTEIEADDAMAALLDYCERSAPGFAAALKPASRQDVDRIVESTGLLAPAEYRSFLLIFGRADFAALAPFMKDVEFGCDAVEDFYRDAPVPIPADALYLWTSGGDCEMFLGMASEWAQSHPVLSFSWSSDEKTGRIRPDERLPFVVAGSLFGCLFQEAYSSLHLPSLAHHLELREIVVHDMPRTEVAASERARRFVSVVERLGFRRLPWLDADMFIYDRGDAVVSLASSMVAEDSMRVGANDEREANRIAEILCDNLGARRFG